MDIDKRWFFEAAKRWLFPEPRKWLSKKLVIAGIAMATGPFWEPYARALFARHTGIQIEPSDGTAGWVILGLGVVFIGINHYLDRKPVIKVDPALAAADRETITAFFSTFHIPTLNSFIDYGKSMYTYVPVIYYYAGIQEFVESASFHLNDLELRTEVEGLYVGLNKALSQGDYFHSASNEKLQKFDSRRDIYRCPDARQAHEDFLSGVQETEVHLKALNRLIKTKFPDFSTTETSREALAERKRYQRQSEEA